MSKSRRASVEDLELQFALTEALLMEARPQKVDLSVPETAAAELLRRLKTGTEVPRMAAALRKAVGTDKKLADNADAALATLERNGEATPPTIAELRNAVRQARASIAASAAAPAPSPAAPASTPQSNLGAAAAASAAAPKPTTTTAAPAAAPTPAPRPASSAPDSSKPAAATLDLVPAPEGEARTRGRRRDAAELALSPEAAMTPKAEAPKTEAPKAAPATLTPSASAAPTKAPAARGSVKIDLPPKYKAWAEKMATSERDGREKMVADLVDATSLAELPNYIKAIDADASIATSPQGSRAKFEIQRVIDQGKPLPVGDAGGAKASPSSPEASKTDAETLTAKGKESYGNPAKPGEANPTPEARPSGAKPHPANTAAVAHAVADAMRTSAKDSGAGIWSVEPKAYSGVKINSTVSPYGKNASKVVFSLDFNQDLDRGALDPFVSRLGKALKAAGSVDFKHTRAEESRQRRRSAEELEEGLVDAVKAFGHATGLARSAEKLAQRVGHGYDEEDVLNKNFGRALGTAGLGAKASTTAGLTAGKAAATTGKTAFGGHGQGTVEGASLKAVSGGRHNFKAKVKFTFDGVGSDDAVKGIWAAIRGVINAASA